MKYLFILFFLPLSAFAQVSLSFEPVPHTPQLFGEGIISTLLSERDMALSPDGNELLYTVQVPAAGIAVIVSCTKNAKGAWQSPQVASFSGQYSDLEPAFSADGKKLFFASNRPVQGNQPKDFDIWYTEKVKGQWSTPVNIGSPVNTTANEFYPSVAKNGNLYFTATYKKGVGQEDIYLAKWENGKYLEPVALDTGVNSPLYEYNAFVSPDEDFILFTSYGRKDDKGRGDLYISLKNATGNWQPAVHLDLISSDKADFCPFVSFDKKILFFTSERQNIPSYQTGKPVDMSALRKIAETIENGNTNIYWISFDAVLKSINK